MKHTKRVAASAAATILSIGMIAGLAPAASAADGTAPAGCSKSERTALRGQISTAKDQINGLRGSKPASAEKGSVTRQASTERRAQIDPLKTTIRAAKDALEACRAAAKAAKTN